MTETESTSKYGVTEAKPTLPARGLLRAPHEGKVLVAGFPAFGPDTYERNLAKMQGGYSHSEALPEVTFREPTTAESISLASFNFEAMAKPQIFDTRWLQAGRIVRTSEGVFTNTSEIGPSALSGMLSKAKKVNGLYIVSDTVAYAPYESFERNIQGAEKFVEGGLARALEHTRGRKAKKLAVISSPGFYQLGVDVWGFEPVSQPVAKVVSLLSYRGVSGRRLSVGGDDWGGYDGGSAFGVRRDAGEASAAKKNLR